MTLEILSADIRTLKCSSAVIVILTINCSWADMTYKCSQDVIVTFNQNVRRLSAVAANRLRDNNPGIADLSDPNRPIKLGEKASEIYDNEWTDALENLEKLRKATETNYDEEKDVQLLLSILTVGIL